MSGDAVRGILRQAMPDARRFAPGLISGVLSAAAAIGLLLVSGWLIVSASLVDSLVPLSVAVVGVRFFAVSRAVFRYLERLSGHDAALRRLAGLRAGIVRRLIPFSPAGLGSTDRGAVLSALVDDVENLQNLPLRVVQPLLTGGIIAIGSVAVMALVSPAAALAMAVCLVVAAALAVLLGWVVGARAERQVAARRAALSGALVDYLGSLEVLLAYGAEAQARRRIRTADAALRRTVTRAALAQSLSGAVVSVAAGAASIWALVAAVPGAPGGAADAAWFAVAVLLPMAVFEVFAVVPQAAASWRSVRAGAERVAALLPAELPAELRPDAPEPSSPSRDGALSPSSDDGSLSLSSDDGSLSLSKGGSPSLSKGPVPSTGSLSPSKGGSLSPSKGPVSQDGSLSPSKGPVLALRDLRATWPGAAEPALRGVDLAVAAGERVLITGPSGAGKSTLAAVLVGFLRHDGSYSVQGRDADGIPGPELREIVGLCEQAPQLFDEDIRQNLLFARDTATDDELLAVLARVGLAVWTAERGGLDARVGERGALVSGGQAQRIALARALLRGFPILVLDEPTAGVDAAASEKLLGDLLRASRGQTVVLISHVEPPAGAVDRTVRIVDGRTP